MLLLENLTDTDEMLDEMEVAMYPGHAALSNTKKK